MPDSIDFEALWTTYGNWVLFFGLKVIGALLVLVIGLRVARWLSGLVRKLSLQHEEVDDTLGNFFASLVRWFLTAALFIAILQIFGVQATSFVAILGAMTLAIGLSLQGALGNIASGVMIMLFRPYKLGDYIEAAGAAGTVKDINLFQTVLATSNNIQILIPNSQAISGVITNYSGYSTRRADIVFSIDYNDDMDLAVELIRKMVEADERVLSYPEPFVKVTSLSASSVDITVRAWASTKDYWDVHFALTSNGKKVLDEAGISIPYPHQVVIQKQG